MHFSQLLKCGLIGFEGFNSNALKGSAQDLGDSVYSIVRGLTNHFKQYFKIRNESGRRDKSKERENDPERWLSKLTGKL